MRRFSTRFLSAKACSCSRSSAFSDSPEAVTPLRRSNSCVLSAILGANSFDISQLPACQSALCSVSHRYAQRTKQLHCTLSNECTAALVSCTTSAQRLQAARASVPPTFGHCSVGRPSVLTVLPTLLGSWFTVSGLI